MGWAGGLAFAAKRAVPAVGGWFAGKAKMIIVGLLVTAAAGTIASVFIYVRGAEQAKARYAVVLQENQTFQATQNKNQAEIQQLQRDQRTWDELFEALNGHFDQKINELSLQLTRDQAERQARSAAQLKDLMETFKNDQKANDWSIVPLPDSVRPWVQNKADQAAGIRQ